VQLKQVVYVSRPRHPGFSEPAGGAGAKRKQQGKMGNPGSCFLQWRDKIAIDRMKAGCSPADDRI
jgi:hypothetical protein